MYKFRSKRVVERLLILKKKDLFTIRCSITLVAKDNDKENDRCQIQDATFHGLLQTKTLEKKVSFPGHNRKNLHSCLESSKT